MLRQIYETALPFNRLLGMRILSLEGKLAVVRVDMRTDLVGNPFRESLHGGVIGAVIDVAGGLAASLGLLAAFHDLPDEEVAKRMARLSTVDMRVDFLRPGLGEHFICRAQSLRTGQKIGHARMDFENDQGELIAVGMGTYYLG
ncbi:MAG: thioesterase family protein [Myxococcota bacterium]|nr:thioesterase family protein [Myxococcota bacterium]